MLVLPPRSRTPIRPWVTCFLDDYSRRLMGWALSARPTQATVLAALRDAMLPDPETGRFGGVPDRLFWDNGLEFLANAVTDVAVALGALPLQADAYSPHQKGKVERFNRTVEQELLSGLPFYADGPRRKNGDLYGGNGTVVDFEVFVGLFDEWVTHYNSKRKHKALDRQTPDERWLSDQSPLRIIPEQELRWLSLPSEERKVRADGIHHRRHIYMAPELQALVGEIVEVRYMPHDTTKVDIFRNGEWLATVRRQDDLSREERAQVLAERDRSRREAARELRRARSRARRQFAPITGPGAIVETTDFRTQDAADARSQERRRTLEVKARTDLLGLGEDLDAPVEDGDPESSSAEAMS